MVAHDWQGREPLGLPTGKINSINRLALVILWVGLCVACVSHVMVVVMSANDDSDDGDGDV